MHSAHYWRKPRGGPPDLCEAFELRFSLCCGRSGCRRRVQPPSVRFWGRRVYWAPVMVLVTALRQGRNPDATLVRLKALCGVWRSTIRRWRHYFRDLFTDSAAWRRVSGRLMPPLAADRLPRSLLQRVRHSSADARSALVTCLKLLALGP